MKKQVYLVDDGSERHWYVATSKEEALRCFLSDWDVDEPEDLEVTELAPNELLSVGFDDSLENCLIENAVQVEECDAGFWGVKVWKTAAQWAAETGVECLASTCV